MALDRDGNIYLAERRNHRVTKFNSSWARLMQFGTGVEGASTLQLSGPSGVAVDRAGRVHVADGGNDRIMVFAPDGSFIRTFGSLGSAPGRLDYPISVAVASNGDVFVADHYNYRVQQFDSVGNLIHVFPMPGEQQRSWAVAVDSADNLYIGTNSDGILRYSLRASKPSA
jgi:DNA-binding beta-propeller fold protein YncE